MLKGKRVLRIIVGLAAIRVRCSLLMSVEGLRTAEMYYSINDFSVKNGSNLRFEQPEMNLRNI